MVRFGIDVFLQQATDFQSKRLALVTNQAATTASYSPSRQALISAGFPIRKLFSPEHGLDAIGDDGQLMPNGTDPLTRLPIVSLYGTKLQPSEEDLADIDVVIVDLPDIGCRFYTYLWTLTYVMEACCQYHKPLILLDRPNPLSGRMDLVEGPMLDEATSSSFIGRWAIPLRHSCTFGELAQYWQHQRFPNLSLTVVNVEGWQRTAFSRDWQSSFVPTSPAMVNPEAALLYPGLGLLEATNLSEGRGTATPFQLAGAPWLDAYTLTDRFNQLVIPGVIARALTFTPQSGKYAGELCQGVMFHVTDAAVFHAVLSGMLFIKLVYDRHPVEFNWAPYPTYVNPTGKHHLDKLLGLPNSEALFKQPLASFRETAQTLTTCAMWEKIMKPFLLY
ncbi:exo-beta-N-acetylmuramidase NamZ family protein [Spirosoma gilvum]